jgi:hypothetical protein
VIRCRPELHIDFIRREGLSVIVSDGERVLRYLACETVGITRRDETDAQVPLALPPDARNSVFIGNLEQE